VSSLKNIEFLILVNRIFEPKYKHTCKNFKILNKLLKKCVRGLKMKTKDSKFQSRHTTVKYSVKQVHKMGRTPSDQVPILTLSILPYTSHIFFTAKKKISDLYCFQIWHIYYSQGLCETKNCPKNLR